MRRNQWFGCGLVAALFMFSGGCAVVPLKSQSALRHAPNAERDMLAEATAAVEATPWPKPQSVSLLNRITGAGAGRVTRSEAVDAYLASLSSAEGLRFQHMASDARSNIDAAASLNKIAQNAMNAPRLSTNDLVMIERSIQTLRENRQIYGIAAKSLAKNGAPVNEHDMDAIRDDYAEVIKALGDTADQFADRIEDNRSETYASPAKPASKVRNNFSGT